ncbi:signal recognition particle-docking protein FtsY [Brucella anthropi]|uniref:Signal recognition particle receptor FtsY n=1 Tax=Brucella anthropi (strain ATCC 49188 / DSM 6882 / CCUG 24695 / JCM 21032 / LMG 3331 / NBRC 15819 / NCTC 12168 / Alc 37) TaxID=439375 RepID=A6WXE2_BRUA4|nr:signal recognition particle-docking protein FtsY [Brucella anthropi]ABS13646.1 signal recognition particle-docking protein FtsY [Brucella anthropi ATCC 49188]AIK45174.1 signal recognition particle-docking protein FtsY [Brucella anthropi]KAB2736873.1 signal recognition particle-docking protein FtsY [Brucella anthropi]KAB2750994.1 signal recognition particle-docking protein FtsY [Brucella anthropi]KAB2779020.1 signal recognition particle-docking protein FtsY [Brucella anthropi]
MAMGFIKKMFSFGKKEVEEKPIEQPAPDAVETALETQLPETVEAPKEIETAVVEVVVSEPEVPVIASEPEPIEEPASETVEEEKTEPEHPVAEIEIPIEQPPVMEPIAVEAPAPEPAIEPVVEPVVEPEAEPAVELEQPEVAKAPDAPVVEEAVEPTPQPEPVKPKKVKVAKAVEEHKEEAPVEAAPQPKLSWFERLRRGLLRSSNSLSESIGGIFTKRKLDDDTLQDLEDVLIQADLGLETAMRVTDALASGRYGKDVTGEEVRTIMGAEIEKVLGPVAKPLELDLSHKPHVILVVGVNGTGKTTTIGKLAAKLTAGGLKVMLAAGDTFRAAAIEQLHIWGERTGSPVVSSKLGADAAGLAYDAWEKAKEAGSDVLIIDTAGRLQNKAELMDELAKIVRVLGKHDPEAPHTVLQTLDATTGQNALNQVEIFKNIAGVNGLVMTKLDGTARGGILVAISAKHKLPIYFIGVGEGVDDLEPFAAKDFARAIAGVA